MTEHIDKPKRARVAVVVFADVDPAISDGWAVVAHLLREKFGTQGEEHVVPMRGGDIRVRFHDAMEVGMAAGNGYLWTEPTSKAFRQYTWQDEDES